ncbi:MAG: hypothetical protein ABIZ34_00605 [Candidatus Limnocylindrales bacterium]
MHRTQAVLLGAATALFVAACSWVPTAFQRTAEDAASTFSSAALTLRLEHGDTESGAPELTREYAASAFVSYREAIGGVADELPRAAGAPTDSGAVTALVAKVRGATVIVQQPCLESSCDWQTQIHELEQTRDALLEAAS